MPVDANIFQMLRMPEKSDAFGDFKKGMEFRKDFDQNLEDRKVKEAFKKGTVIGEDGNPTYDRKATLAELYKVSPQRAMETEQKFAQMDADKYKQQVGLSKDLAWSVQDQGSWDVARQKAKEFGLPGSDKLPDQYDPGFVKKLQYSTLDAHEQLQQQNFRDKLEQQALDRKESRDERRFLAGQKFQEREDVRAEKQAEKMQALETPYGPANTVDDAKQLKTAHEAKSNFDNKVQEMIALRKKHGGGAFFNREDVGRGKQLSKDVLLAYKDMAKLGVLSAADEAILNAIIPEDPLAYDFVPGQDPIAHRLEKFKADSDADFKNKVATRTRGGAATPVGQFSSDVVSYAKTHNITPEQAQAIKNQRESKTGARP